MVRSLIDYQVEVAAIQRQIRLLRDDYLPVIAEHLTDLSDLFWGCPAEGVHLPSVWRRATFELADALPLRQADLVAGTSLQHLEPFCSPVGYPDWIREGERIVWSIGVFFDLNLDRAVASTGQLLGDTLLHTPLQEVVAWLLSIPVDHAALWNGLCRLLPAVTQRHPDVGLMLLQPEFWHRQIRRNIRCRVAAPSSGDDDEFIAGNWFHGILNNAMLHVVAALANNDFHLIGDALDFSTVHGRYTSLMPPYLFSILRTKVLLLPGIIFPSEDGRNAVHGHSDEI